MSRSCRRARAPRLVGYAASKAACARADSRPYGSIGIVSIRASTYRRARRRCSTSALAPHESCCGGDRLPSRCRSRRSITSSCGARRPAAMSTVVSRISRSSVAPQLETSPARSSASSRPPGPDQTGASALSSFTVRPDTAAAGAVLGPRAGGVRRRTSRRRAPPGRGGLRTERGFGSLTPAHLDHII